MGVQEKFQGYAGGIQMKRLRTTALLDFGKTVGILIMYL